MYIYSMNPPPPNKKIRVYDSKLNMIYDINLDNCLVIIDD